MQTEYQSGIVIKHLECYALDSIVSFTCHTQSQTYLTLNSGHTSVAFNISKLQKQLQPQSNTVQSIKPFKSLSYTQVKAQVTKSYITDYITCILDSNHQCTLQSKQIYKNVYDVLLSESSILLVIWKPQQPLKLVVLSPKKTKQDQSDLEQIHLQQFPKTDRIDYCDNERIVATQYIVKIKNGSDFTMLPNPTYDGTSDKRVLLATDSNYLYYQGQNYYLHSTNIYSIEETQSDHITKIPIRSHTSSVSLCFSPSFELLFTIQPMKEQLSHLFSINIYSASSGILLFSLPLKLKKAQFIYPICKCEEITILDLDNFQLLCLKVPCLIFSTNANLQQEKFVHENTIKGLQIRKKQLLSYRKYVQKQQMQSAIRILLNEQNKAFLFDGVRMLYECFRNIQKQGQLTSQSKENIVVSVIKMCQNLLGSKYQSHIQGSLQILVQISKRQYNIIGVKNSLAQIVKMKRVQKMIKQTKKKVLFQLAYQLANKVHGPDFIFNLN